MSSTVSAKHQFLAGQVYRETRPDGIARIENRIRKAYRGKNKNRLRMPQRLYLRVLEVENGQVIVISTEDPRAKTQHFVLDQAEHFVATAGWLLTDHEPLPVLRVPEEQLSARQKAMMKKNTELIQPLIEMDNDALIPSLRWPVVRDIAAARRVSPSHVLRVFTRYLQAGMCTQGLAGRWFRRIRGIGRGCRMKQAAGTPPRSGVGRPRLDGHKSFIVREMDAEKIIKGSRKYFFDGTSAGKRRRAWKLTVADFFLDLDCSDGIPSDAELKQFTPGTYPSYAQFCYWSELDAEFEKLYRKLHGDRNFELWLRRRRNKTEGKVKGPGAVFFIDATPLPWNLVHQTTRLPLEKDATLYLVVDAFSHLIVGFYLHLGPESFDPVSLALLAAAEDKVALCARYGVTIKPGDWVAACLPTRLAEDGAGATYKHGLLVQKKVIRGLTVVPPWRADLKGLIEAFNSSMETKAQSVPGYSHAEIVRGEEKPSTMACLDYFESVRLIISWILQTSRRLDRDYQLTEDMIADGVVPSPQDLWLWGAENLAGSRKTFSHATLTKWCLPTGKARFTRDGVEWGPMLYEPMPNTFPEFNDQCAYAAEHGPWNVTVSYHPGRYTEFYVHDGDELVKMQLAPRSAMYAAWSCADYESFKATTAVTWKKREGENEIYDIAREKEQQQIIESGMAKTAAVRGSVAKRRSDKSDRAASTADQKRLIAGQGVIPLADAAAQLRSDELQQEDEAEIASMMGDSA
jgi:hypothetical protein